MSESNLGAERLKTSGSLLAGGVMIIPGIFLFISAFIAAGKSLFTEESLWMETVGALVFGVAFLVVPLFRWRQTLTVYERGLIHEGILGTTRVPASDVRSVKLIHHGSRGGSHTQLQIWRADGTDVSFSGLKDAEQAAAFIHNWTRADSAAHSSAPAPSTGWQPPGAS